MSTVEYRGHERKRHERWRRAGRFGVYDIGSGVQWVWHDDRWIGFQTHGHQWSRGLLWSFRGEPLPPPKPGTGG